MNHIAVIILVAFFFVFFLNLLADILNLSRLSQDLPTALKDIYDPEKYRNAQSYLKANTRFEWIYAAVQLLITLCFWFGKGFPLLDTWLQQLTQHRMIQGLLFIGLLIFAKGLLDLPFSIYSTFVIEEKFGFNQTTLKTFFLDRLKGVFLTIVLGAPLLAGILAFFEYAGANAWLYCWAAVVMFMLVIQFIAPAWIMPLFNQFTPIESGELKSAILAYAQRIGFALENVFVMDGSKRSSKSNAFFTGFGKHRRIVLFDTLIRQATTTELVAVLAHEMGHYKKHHIFISLAIGIAHTGLIFLLLSFFLSYQGLFDAFYMDAPSVHGGLIFFAMLYTPIELVLGILMQMLSRRNEYAADRFAAETTNDAEALASALKKLSALNLSNLTPHPFYVWLHDSHPPLLERMRALASYRHLPA
ncbi:MAG: M48 family metallopeptidase [Desulfobacterales bacterium]|nr:M48 family metallopeptidase [Desulfobacterales bacterium]